MSLSLVERIRSEMAGVNRWNADTRGTLLFECLEAFAARAEGDPAAEGDIPSIIERGQTGERLSPTEQSAWTGYELGWKDGLKHAISDLGECFECGHDLNGPYCPACNSDIDAARAEGVAALQQAAGDECDDFFTRQVEEAMADPEWVAKWSLPQQTALVEQGVEKIIAQHEPAACGEGTLPSPSEPPRSAEWSRDGSLLYTLADTGKYRAGEPVQSNRLMVTVQWDPRYASDEEGEALTSHIYGGLTSLSDGGEG